MARTKVKGNGIIIGCTAIVSVSASCSRCNNLAWSSCSMTCLLYELYIVSSWLRCIYSIDTILYPYAFPIDSYNITLLLISSLCLSATWALRVKVVTSYRIWKISDFSFLLISQTFQPPSFQSSPFQRTYFSPERKLEVSRLWFWQEIVFLTIYQVLC